MVFKESQNAMFFILQAGVRANVSHHACVVIDDNLTRQLKNVLIIWQDLEKLVQNQSSTSVVVSVIAYKPTLSSIIKTKWHHKLMIHNTPIFTRHSSHFRKKIFWKKCVFVFFWIFFNLHLCFCCCKKALSAYKIDTLQKPAVCLTLENISFI